MRMFTQEEFTNIELGGYLLLPQYFQEGTIGKGLAVNVVKLINNENILEKEKLDEVVFLCYSNGAKLAPMTAVITKEVFHQIENFKKTVDEMINIGMDKSQILNAFLILYLNNIISVNPEEAFINNFVVDKLFHFGLPPVTATINFIDTIIDLIENKKPALITFINFQDSRVEQLLTTKVKNIVDRETQIMQELENSKNKIEQLEAKNKKLIDKNEELFSENKIILEKNKSSVITIVSLIAAIIPFFIINISVLVNSFNIILLLCINGTMCFIISIVYYFVHKIIQQPNKTSIKPFLVFMIIGAVLLVLGIVLWILAATIPQIKDFILQMKM